MDERLQVACCRYGFFLQAPKSAARSGSKPGQRLRVLDGSHTSIRLATSPSHFCEGCVCLLQMVGGGGA
jgi:hypothetical protein